MTAARKHAAPVRDLFDPAPAWTPPPEFAAYLAEREAATAPAPAAAWAVEAATAPASLTVSVPTPRDFTVAEERVRCGGHLVVRRQSTGGHVFRAYERAGVYFHGDHLDGDVAWGRVDTRHATKLDPANPRAAIEHQIEREAEAWDVIRRVCPETARLAGETTVGAGVYEGPGYIRVTSDLERRYQAALAARRPA